MTTQELLTHLVNNERGFEKQRSTALARGQWSKAIELDAKLDYSKTLRQQIVRVEVDEAVPPGVGIDGKVGGI